MFILLLMTVSLAEKQMPAFCLSACVIRSICICSLIVCIELFFHFTKILIRREKNTKLVG